GDAGAGGTGGVVAAVCGLGQPTADKRGGVMGELKRLWQRVVHALWPERGEAELDREIASHLLLLEEEFRRRGESAEEARRSALMMLGGVDQTKELHREARSLAWVDEARRNVSYAVRMLRRRPMVTAAAVRSLAVGIGLNAAVFSVMDWVLLRPLPYPAARELIRVYTAGRAPLTKAGGVTYGEFETLARATAWRASTALSTATRVLA